MYVPINLQVFTAAYSGAMSGLALSNRINRSVVATDYATQCNVASAFAQSFDTEWANAADVDGLQAELIFLGCKGAWLNRSPKLSGISLTPSTYTNECDAIIAAVVQSETTFAGLGITPPPFGGGGSSLPNPSAAGQTLISTGAGPAGSNSVWDLPGGFQITGFSGGQTVEVGANVVNPVFASTYNEIPDSASITNTDAIDSPHNLITPFTGATIVGTFHKTALGATTAFTLSATKGATTRTSQQTITWLARYAYGIAAPGLNDPAVVAAFANTLTNTRLHTETLNVTANNKGYIWHPQAFGLATSWLVGGFPGGMLAPVNLSLTINGVVIPGYLYETTTASLGAGTTIQEN